MRLSHLSRWSVPVFAFLVGLGAPPAVQAAPIGLGVGSSVKAGANITVVGSGTVTSNDVNSLPFNTPTSATMGDAMSTVDSDITVNHIRFGFTQSIASSGSTDGVGEIHFVAGEGVTYTIGGDLTLTGFGAFGELATSLFDVTKGLFVYQYDQFANNFLQGSFSANSEEIVSVLTLDTSGGSLTGSLIAGDSYIFRADENMNNLSDPALVGKVGIAFVQPGPGGPAAAPVPLAVWSGLLLIVGLGCFARTDSRRMA